MENSRGYPTSGNTAVTGDERATIRALIIRHDRRTLQEVFDQEYGYLGK
jgi:hypothetical protein